MSIKNFIEDYSAFPLAFSILKIPQQIIHKPNVKTLVVSKGEIRFIDLCLQYSKGQVIFKRKGVNLENYVVTKSMA